MLIQFLGLSQSYPSQRSYRVFSLWISLFNPFFPPLISFEAFHMPSLEESLPYVSHINHPKLDATVEYTVSFSRWLAEAISYA